MIFRWLSTTSDMGPSWLIFSVPKTQNSSSRSQGLAPASGWPWNYYIVFSKCGSKNFLLPCASLFPVITAIDLVNCCTVYPCITNSHRSTCFCPFIKTNMPTWPLIFPLHPYISMPILNTVHYTFPEELTKRICLKLTAWPVGDHFHYSCDPNVWFRADIVRRN